jgi:hypothetical protein
MKRWIAVALLLAVAGCSYSVVRRVSADDFGAVQEGRFKGNIRVNNGDTRLTALVAAWRQEIEAEPEFLRRVCGQYFSVPDSTEFRFMYVGEDSAGRRVILRYFGFAPKPFIIAGWQAQFVFDKVNRRLDAVHVAEVPLE